MSEASSKKRKRDGETSGKPTKKVVIEAPPATASVSSVLQPKLPPVVAATPGIELPRQILFDSYQRRADGARRPRQGVDDKADLFLHSDAQDGIDYTCAEETPQGSKSMMRHYVGIYDPSTGKLSVVEAKKMVVRSQVRSRQAALAEATDERLKKTYMERKTELGEAFGSKKAKKALRDNALNAIAATPKDGEHGRGGEASKAMLNSVGALTSLMATREELQAVVDAAKPVPPANLEATEASEVYKAEKLIGADVLELVPIREWQEKARRGEGIQVPSRFVATRLNALAVDDAAVGRLRVLRYIDLVLQFFYLSREGRERGTRRVPSVDKLRELLEGVPSAVLESIRRKFSENGMMRKFHIDLLMTHCCVYALLVNNLDVCVQELRDDVKIGHDLEMKQYFKEIGARLRRVKNEGTGRMVDMARLEVPLELPKQRRAGRGRR